jgi:hypothetical protein
MPVLWMRRGNGWAAPLAAWAFLLTAYLFCVDISGEGSRYDRLATAIAKGLAGDHTKYADDYSEEAFRKVRIGMSRDEVEALLGKPLLVYDPGHVPTDEQCGPAGDGYGDNGEWWYSNFFRKSGTEDGRGWTKRRLEFHLGHVAKIVREYDPHW